MSRDFLFVAPSKPLSVEFVGERTETSLTVRWRPPANPYGILKGYRVSLLNFIVELVHSLP